jgi:hypothetical protein
VRLALVGKQAGSCQHRLAVGAPADRQRPARQLLAGVPLALAEVQEAALAVFVAQLVHQLGGIAALGRAQGVGVPFGASRSFTATKVGSPPMVRRTSPADQFAASTAAPRAMDGGPLLVGVGQGDARGFVDARDLHVVGELDLALVDAAFDGRGADGLGVQASGMWPSPASRPEVASSPTQPAPGR